MACCGKTCSKVSVCIGLLLAIGGHLPTKQQYSGCRVERQFQPALSSSQLPYNPSITMLPNPNRASEGLSPKSPQCPL